jgi:hypothetical protein
MENKPMNSPISFATQHCKDNNFSGIVPRFNFNLINPESIKKECDQLLDQNNKQRSEAGFFLCRTANDCIQTAKAEPIPRKLFYSLIFENELTVLFADTGVGKSIFAVQIANELSKTERYYI